MKKVLGAIARKVGMSEEFTEEGKRHAITYIQIFDDCNIIGEKNFDKHGYSAVVVGAQIVEEKKVSRPLAGSFKKHDIAPRKIIREFRVDTDELSMLPVGMKLDTSNFKEGQTIKITGISTGKGYAGTMKRHNFRGLRATHGVSISHRSPGSTGQRQDPGKVFKGKKMAGHLGMNKVTEKRCIIGIDLENNVLKIKGAVVGKPNGLLIIRAI